MESTLLAEGIPTILDNEQSATWTFGETGPATLLVPEDRLEEAHDLLVARGHLRRPGPIRCPACGSEAVERLNPIRWWMWPLIVLSLGLALLLTAVLGREKQCGDCGARFRDAA